MWNMANEEEGGREVNERPEELEGPVDVAALRQQLREANTKAEEYLLSWQRAQADFQNLRRRLEQDKLDYVKYAEGDVIKKLLPILDDMDRALRHTPPELKSNAWAQGMDGIFRKFRGTLEGIGLAPIPSLGLPFDPAVHEAVMHVPGPSEMVMAEYERGYKLKERVLRPARVAVGNGEEATE